MPWLLLLLLLLLISDAALTDLPLEDLRQFGHDAVAKFGFGGLGARPANVAILQCCLRHSRSQDGHSTSVRARTAKGVSRGLPPRPGCHRSAVS